MTKEQLLSETEDLLRTMPPRATMRHETQENLAWLGRVSAVIEEWDMSKGILLRGYLDQFQEINARTAGEGFRKMLTLLHQARYSLRMQTIGPANIAIPHGMVFDYFDEIRKVIELA